MLKSVKFISGYRNFKKGDAVQLRENLNIIVGDQGAGKSSILELLNDLSSSNMYASHCIEIEKDSDMQVLRFDFEKDNPRTKEHIGVDAGFQLSTHFQSHGQTVNDILWGLPGAVENAKADSNSDVIIVLDEPDTGLSIRSCHKLIKLLKKLAKGNTQIICSIHNPIVIGSAKEVLDIESLRWVESSNYIKTQSRRK